MDGERPQISGAQIRAARALLDLSAGDLAELAGLSRGVIQRAEIGPSPVVAANLARIVEVLERQGIIFLASNGEGPGVRLRKRRK